MGSALALAWPLKGAGIELTPRESKLVGANKVDYDFSDVKLAEVLRVISTKAGCQYRIVGKEIRLATADEWKEIDAGKKTFDDLVEKAESKK